MVDPKAPESSNGFFSDIITEMFTSPLNLVLVAVIAFLVYKIFQSRYKVPEAVVAEKSQNLPPKLRKDFTLEELKNYDGKQPCGRILVAVNGKVFDVTKGKQFYGPGGPYAIFGGRDASRGLATFNLNAIPETYDDLSDLSRMEMDSVREWEIQFKEKYEYVGRLLKPGEEPSNYSEEEEEGSSVETDKEKPKAE